MNVERLPAAAARELAASLVAELETRAPRLLKLDRIDLAGALEQQLFFALRDGSEPPSGLGRLRLALLGTGRLVAATTASLLVRRPPQPGPRPLVALVAAPVHFATLLQIEHVLQESASEAIAVVRVGRAASTSAPHAMAPRLAELLDPCLIPSLLGHWLSVRAHLGRATIGWSAAIPAVRAQALRRIAAIELDRIALGATGLGSVARRWQPSLLVAFDEVGTWARLLPAVGRRYGIASLDLPHAEAADAIAIRGAGYDRMAVYGRRAAAVLREAGISAGRIVEIGAPRFDPLLADGRDRPASAIRRVVFAAQYLKGAMTRELLELSFLGARAAAGVLAPSELVIVRHPAEQSGLIAGMVADHPAEPGVEVRSAAQGGLHAELPGATLLVTGWSNSVLEAACLGVPAITVVQAGVAPVDFAADGLALSAHDAGEAADAARRLLTAGTRDEVIARARSAIGEHIGPLDGRASERAARIMLQMAGRTSVEPAI